MTKFPNKKQLQAPLHLPSVIFHPFTILVNFRQMSARFHWW